MTYALVVVEGPKLDEKKDEVELRWTAFLRTTENRTEPNLTIERLAQDSWLIPLDKNLQTLGGLVEDSRKAGFPCRVLFLDLKPSFNNS